MLQTSGKTSSAEIFLLRSLRCIQTIQTTAHRALVDLAEIITQQDNNKDDVNTNIRSDS